jgi:hypothetical protein
MIPTDRDDTQPAIPPETVTDEARREAMRRMAKYTAPAMLAMLLSDKALAQTLT